MIDNQKKENKSKKNVYFDPRVSAAASWFAAPASMNVRGAGFKPASLIGLHILEALFGAFN